MLLSFILSAFENSPSLLVTNTLATFSLVGKVKFISKSIPLLLLLSLVIVGTVSPTINKLLKLSYIPNSLTVTASIVADCSGVKIAVIFNIVLLSTVGK